MIKLVTDDTKAATILAEAVDDVRRLVAGNLDTSAITDNATFIDEVSSLGVGVAQATAKAMSRPYEPPKKRDPNTLYFSEIGETCSRKLWYKVNMPATEEVLPYNTRIKFLYGDIIEEMTLGLFEMAGHEVTHRQAPVEYKDGIYTVRGRIDAVIGGVLVDVKSASSYGYKKFEAHGLTLENDTFGYLSQLAGYRTGIINPGILSHGAGFIAIHRDLGHITSDYYFDNELPFGLYHDFNAHIDALGGAAFQSVIPTGRFDTVAEGTSGNRKLCTKCSYCGYKKLCWADSNSGTGLRTFLYSNGPMFLTSISKLPKVPEIT